MGYTSPPSSWTPVLILLLATLAACDDDTIADVSACDVLLEEVSPDAGLVGETITVSGSPFTTHYDTALVVGGKRAEVTAVDRTNCDACDECLVEQSCNACEDCDECDIVCRVDCTENLTFIVPEATPGEQPLLLYNAHGSSNTLVFVIQEVVDTEDSGGD